MSTYENYNKTSLFFDKTRSALGLDIIRNAMEKCQVSLNEQVLVDAGCGTGLYSEALIDDVKYIEAIDSNIGMLEIAKARMESIDKNKKIRFHKTTIDSLPLEDESIDSIIVNQVLHHLPDSAKSNWKEHKKVFIEFYRVLKPSGVLIINSCSPKQLSQGFWFYCLIPEALNTIIEKTIDLKTLSKELVNIGFSTPRYEIPLNLILQNNEYLNADGIFDPEWRSGDSIWSLVSKKILSKVLEKVSILKENGEFEDFIKKHDKKRLTSGQITFTITRKNDNENK